MKIHRKCIVFELCLVSLALSGCASTHSNLVSGSNLGVQEYKPAVYVKDGNEQKYQEVLAVCRRVAVNRQLTAADEAQLRNITGSIEGTASGVATGLEFGSLLSSIGVDTDLGKAAGLGAAAGLIGSLASSFASGTERTASETKRVLLTCLKQTSDEGRLWEVLE